MIHSAAPNLIIDVPLRPVPLLPLARWQFSRLLETMLWFIGIVIVALPLLTWYIVDRYGDQLSVSIWAQFVTHGPAWFLLALGVKATSTYLPVLVAMGATRSRSVSASALALLAGAFCLGLFAAAGLLFEAALYRGYGLEQVLTSTHLYSSVNDVGLVIGEYAIRYLVFGLTGMLTGLAYYRFGGVIGTGLLIVTLLPIAILGVGMSPADIGLSGMLREAFGNGEPGLLLTAQAVAVRLALAAILALLTFYTVRFFASRVALRTKVG